MYSKKDKVINEPCVRFVCNVRESAKCENVMEKIPFSVGSKKSLSKHPSLLWKKGTSSSFSCAPSHHSTKNPIPYHTIPYHWFGVTPMHTSAHYSFVQICRFSTQVEDWRGATSAAVFVSSLDSWHDTPLSPKRHSLSLRLSNQNGSAGCKWAHQLPSSVQTKER